MKRCTPLLLCAFLAACTTNEGDTIIIQQIAPSSSSAAEASMSSSANADNPLPSSGSPADASSSQNTDYSSSSANEAQSSGGISSSEASSSSSSEDNLLRDARDGQTYKTVKIGEQTWMAENLKYAYIYSGCYENKESNCDSYGRLYNWATATNFDFQTGDECNRILCYPSASKKYRGVCPSGWHLPNNGEWQALIDFVGGTAILSAHPGFAAQFGGYVISDMDNRYIGDYGFWWSATEYNATNAHHIELGIGAAPMSFISFMTKRYGLSIRCVKD